MGKGGDTVVRAVAPEPDATTPEVSDRITVRVPRGGRVVVASDLHLTGRPAHGSVEATEDLAAALDGVSGPGVVVLAGDCLEMLADSELDPSPALDAHPSFTASVAAWAARPDRSVVVLAGNHDGPLAWHPQAATTMQRRLGATVALSVDLELDTEAGPRRVRVEHGHQIDPANAFIDPRDPAETPLGHHVVKDLLPLLDGVTGDGWAQGLELMADPVDLPAMVASRLAYRRVVPALIAAAVPALAAAVLGLAWVGGAPVGPAAAVALAVAVAVAVAVVGGALFWGGLGWRSVRPLTVDLSGGAEPGNDAPRRRAAGLAQDGVHAYVTGHTHIPELSLQGDVLYANSGCGGGLLHRRPGRGPCPDAFTVARHVSWVELDAGADLVARLVVGVEEIAALGRWERWATRPATPAPPRPTVVASFVGAGVPVAATPLVPS